MDNMIGRFKVLVKLCHLKEMNLDEPLNTLLTFHGNLDFGFSLFFCDLVVFKIKFLRF